MITQYQQKDKTDLTTQVFITELQMQRDASCTLFGIVN